MPSQSDHVRRDAQHAARSLIRIRIAQYLRRLDELAKGEIQQAIEEATAKGELVDGAALGALAANRALGTYGIESVKEAIESESSAPALEAGD